MSKKKISILIPMYNEQEVLPALFGRVTALMNSHPTYEWEVMMVNDGSRDATMSMVMRQHQLDPRFRYVDLSRNFGKEIAMMAGFDYVTGDAVVVMDADLQHPPEVIPDMIEKWEEGYDDVYGERLTRGKEPWLRRKLSLLYYKMLQKSTNIPILENTGDFRLLDRSCVDALASMREQHRYTKGMYCYIGFRKTSVPFTQGDREAGKTKWNLFKLLGLALEGFTSYTTMPLRVASVLGIVSSLASVIYGIVVLVRTLVYGEVVRGFPTLIISILFLGGVILLTLGIIGEYLGRIFDETKGRPVYFVREVDGHRPDCRGSDRHINS